MTDIVGLYMDPPEGAVVQSISTTDAGVAALMVQDVSQGPRNSLFTQTGDVFGYLVVVGFGVLIVGWIMTWRRQVRRQNAEAVEPTETAPV